jgi:hypothetical protein
MKRAILEVDDEHKCTNAGTPSSSTIRKALPGLKAGSTGLQQQSHVHPTTVMHHQGPLPLSYCLDPTRRQLHLFQHVSQLHIHIPQQQSITNSQC